MDILAKPDHYATITEMINRHIKQSSPIPMDEGLERSPPKQESGSYDGNSQNGLDMVPQIPPYAITPEELESQMTLLEGAIRTQKESSVNAKTAITFDQLRQIHAIGKLLGPAKDHFYDRICRAADIQRASLKNRLKQNKEKFIQKPTTDMPGSLAAIIRTYQQRAMQPPQTSTEMGLDYLQALEPISSITASVNQHMAASQIANGLLSPSLSSLGGMNGLILEQASETVSAEERQMQERAKIPPQRMLQLLQLGFSYEELKQVNDHFHNFVELARENALPPSSVRESFSNFLSQNGAESLKWVSSAYNMLEMGYAPAAIGAVIASERARKRSASDIGEEAVATAEAKRLCVDADERKS